MTLAYSAAADRNKEVIGDALECYLREVTNVIEIGSGTGQHAVYLSDRFKSLRWLPTDKEENLQTINCRVSQSGLNNIETAIEVDVSEPPALRERYDFAYSANTAHIMSMAEVVCMFKMVAALLQQNSYFALYGPFKYHSQPTSPSNQSFDAMLRQQARHMGIRDKAELDAIAFEFGFDFTNDIAMPANNRLLLWRR